jgi:glycosyltransferase involved in cell wall biosynthesis
MNGLNICFICFRFGKDWSGIALSARRIVLHLVDLGYNVHIVTPVIGEKDSSNALSFEEGKGSFLSKESVWDSGVTLHEVSILKEDGGFPSNSFITMALTIELLHKKHKFNLFHAFTFSATYFAISVAKQHKIPIIGSFRGVDGHTLLGSQYLLPYLRASLKAADWITSVSSDLLRNINRLESVTHKASVILNGIDCQDMPSWSINSCEKGVIGTAAELRYKKGIHLLPSVFYQLDRHKRLAVRLIGHYSDDVEKVRVEKELERYGVSENFENLGYLPREDLLIEICKFHIFVIPSLHDGLPNALLEACSCGLPIVAANVSGMADILTDGENALLCEPGDARSFSTAINKLLNSDALCEKLSHGAKALASEMNTDKERQEWKKLYRKLLNLSVET